MQFTLLLMTMGALIASSSEDDTTITSITSTPVTTATADTSTTVPTTATAEMTTSASEGLPWWAWLLIALGGALVVSALLGGLAYWVAARRAH